MRRVNQAIWLLCTGAREASFRNIKSIAECLADELINAAKVSHVFLPSWGWAPVPSDRKIVCVFDLTLENFISLVCFF
ncbi:hypothetical protein DPMN_147785 [Dreissena polymorpha]|uniref:Small ribosomal subunit protein uS7 domain-containing protein n=1 Tax=Dreissena polymorpha TaxID=45954 RepID=A0A9D4J393_DREPO|nr:hypothetical protein DPMN_147785 [Dreissena polymorpha]